MAPVDCLVIGANGLIGRCVIRLFRDKKISSVGTYNKRPEDGLFPLNITDEAALQKVFSEWAPKTVYLCANLSGGVDFCEKNPQSAEGFYLNATKDIGRLCKKSGATLVFISTDYVFDGTKGPYKEDDGKNPLNLYGKLKLEAEDWIQGNLDEYVIARTTNVFGWDPQTVTPNYIMNLYRTVKSGKPFNAPSYLWGNPTYAGDLALALIELSDKKASGVFHIVGGSFVNRFDWASGSCEVLGLDAGLIKEVNEPQQNIVPRPFKSWLSTEKFRGSYNTVLHDLTQGISFMKQDMEKDRGI